MTLRRLRPDEAKLFKDLRLRALAEAPDAFAHTFAEISAKTDEYWEEMTRSVTEPGRHVMFVAEEGAAPVGMAFGIVDREREGAGHLGGMWTEPARRGRGIGQALAEAVIAWARERGFDHLVLWVTEGNRPAIALYERLGFAATGRHDRLPANPTLGVLEMKRPLGQAPAALG